MMGAGWISSENPSEDGRQQTIAMLPGPRRLRPNETGSVPDLQLDKRGDRMAVGLLITKLAGLPQVERTPSRRGRAGTIDVPLAAEPGCRPLKASRLGCDSMQIHPLRDSELRENLPSAIGAWDIDARWAKRQPLHGPLLFCPVFAFISALRKKAERRVGAALVQTACAYARGH